MKNVIKNCSGPKKKQINEKINMEENQILRPWDALSGKTTYNKRLREKWGGKRGGAEYRQTEEIAQLLIRGKRL